MINAHMRPGFLSGALPNSQFDEQLRRKRAWDLGIQNMLFLGTFIKAYRECKHKSHVLYVYPRWHQWHTKKKVKKRPLA